MNIIWQNYDNVNVRNIYQKILELVKKKHSTWSDDKCRVIVYHILCEQSIYDDHCHCRKHEKCDNRCECNICDQS